jgi:histidine triad (HIT) family protein
MTSECIFCRIVSGDVPAEVILEDDVGIALRDVNPEAPVHVLVIPRQHFRDATELAASDSTLISRLFSLAIRVANAEGIADTGYRLVLNTGADGGQTVGHVHIHVLGGRQLSWPPG